MGTAKVTKLVGNDSMLFTATFDHCVHVLLQIKGGQHKLFWPDSVAYHHEAKSLCERAAILMEHPMVIKC